MPINPIDPQLSTALLGPWERFELANNTLPGYAVVEVSKGAHRKIDDRSGAGSDGWRLLDKGPKPIEFTVELIFWLAVQMTNWLDISPDLARRFRTRGNRTAHRVYHPALAAIGCDRAYLEELGALENKGKQEWRVKLKFKQYQPATPRGHTAAVVQGTNGPGSAIAATNAPNANPQENGQRPPAGRNTSPRTTATSGRAP